MTAEQIKQVYEDLNEWQLSDQGLASRKRRLLLDAREVILELQHKVEDLREKWMGTLTDVEVVRFLQEETRGR
jgi:E3 ubiquitin-protein ligase DOA10